MITTASSIIIGLVLTVCDGKDNCEIYIPATYETKVLASEMPSPNNGAQLTIELGKELCRADFKKYVNEAMTGDEYYVLDAKCVRLTD